MESQAAVDRLDAQILESGSNGQGGNCQVLELARGIEPPTCGLQNHCSAIELRQHCPKFPIDS